MKKIGLLSDTHSHLEASILQHFAECDEIWHAGDIGNVDVANQLAALKPLRAVHGNIDGAVLRQRYPLDLRFTCEAVDVFITHIGGYPGRYTTRVRHLLQQNPPQLYICGHSHILKIMPDQALKLLHINPGACGKEGFHQMKTIVRFTLEAGTIRDVEVIELGKRGEVV